MHNNSNLILFIHSQDRSRQKLRMITKGHNSVVDLRKWVCNISNIDVVKVNAYAKSDQIPSIRSQDNKWKQNSDDKQGP